MDTKEKVERLGTHIRSTIGPFKTGDVSVGTTQNGEPFVKIRHDWEAPSGYLLTDENAADMPREADPAMSALGRVLTDCRGFGFDIGGINPGATEDGAQDWLISLRDAERESPSYQP